MCDDILLFRHANLCFFQPNRSGKSNQKEAKVRHSWPTIESSERKLTTTIPICLRGHLYRFNWF